MARIPIRELCRLRHTVLCHQQLSTLVPSIPTQHKTAYQSDKLLNSCHNTRQLVQIHAHLITSGLFQCDPCWPIRILKHSSDFGDIDCAVLVFRCIESPGTFCVNNVIKAYSLSSVPHKAVVFYFEMLSNGFCPNGYSFVSLFGSCAKIKSVDLGQMCHGQAVKNGVSCVLEVQNSMIHMYGCCGDVRYGKKVFDEMRKRDLVSWNSIVNGFARYGYLRGAHAMFDRMTERNVVSWNIMIVGYLNVGSPGCALMLFRRMANMGLRGNDTTMVSVLSACGRSARLKEGRSVHGFLMRTSFKSGIFLDTSLIDMYVKCQKVEEAQIVFAKMVNKNLVCWNAMILGHCIQGHAEDGLNLFAEMVGTKGLEHGARILPDEVTFIGVLCACARTGLLTEGRNFFSQMVGVYSIKPNFAHYWCMANIYAGAGFIEEAEDIARKMLEDDEHLSSESLMWANLLSSCRFKGNVTLGERIANSLIDMQPRNVSHYRLLLNVYAVAGHWDDVARVKEMIKKRRLEQMPGCYLVDLNEIVHNYSAGHYLLGKTEEINMLSDQNLRSAASEQSSL